MSACTENHGSSGDAGGKTAASPAGFEEPRLKSTSHLPPRKVAVGTVHQGFPPPYPGLDKRLEQLGVILDRAAEAARSRCGRSLDLAVLPEMAVTGGLGGWEGDALARSLPFDGPVRDAFARKAREHRCYLVVPMVVREDDPPGRISNAAFLLDRRGDVAGTYRKMHLAVRKDNDALEGGTTPGREAPVFDCDFGRLGIQICFDSMFEDGWRELARKGAEIVVWPTMRPSTAHALARAMRHRYYIVSSTWGRTAHILEPTGKIVAEALPEDPILVQELDLSYAILVSWAGRPGERGAGLKEKFGDRLGFRFCDEDGWGIFWSNDPSTSIGEMARSVGAIELEDELERTRRLYRKAGLPGS